MIAVSKLFKSIPNELGSMINSIPKKNLEIFAYFSAAIICRKLKIIKINPLPSI